MKQEDKKSKENWIKVINCKYYLGLIVLLFISCKNEIKDIPENIPKNNTVLFGKIEINFPDTIIINKEYKGSVIYSSLFDTLNLEKGKYRFVSLYLKDSEKKTKYSDVKKVAYDTFGMYEDKIRFKVDFKQIGNNYLNGFIEDEVFIEDGKPNGKTRIINKVSEFHKLVFVKER
ncbi:hypothetical protein QWY99_05045 [Flavobacterium branchiarum]|uniref:DUF4249 family protein n=1 Tax=Flavobacterium branchiarum TaxID=1114870 RepID=A0ABV5FK13_9FLAO|nr:hypothetical protein [Flavobacterium branchiarum]MDN3672422.1 hypothetical protein [Flavobacterium branchiarum]